MIKKIFCMFIVFLIIRPCFAGSFYSHSDYMVRKCDTATLKSEIVYEFKEKTGRWNLASHPDSRGNIYLTESRSDVGSLGSRVIVINPKTKDTLLSFKTEGYGPSACFIYRDKLAVFSEKLEKQENSEYRNYLILEIYAINYSTAFFPFGDQENLSLEKIDTKKFIFEDRYIFGEPATDFYSFLENGKVIGKFTYYYTTSKHFYNETFMYYYDFSTNKLGINRFKKATLLKQFFTVNKTIFCYGDYSDSKLGSDSLLKSLEIFTLDPSTLKIKENYTIKTINKNSDQYFIDLEKQDASTRYESLLFKTKDVFTLITQKKKNRIPYYSIISINTKTGTEVELFQLPKQKYERISFIANIDGYTIISTNKKIISINQNDLSVKTKTGFFGEIQRAAPML